RCGRTCRRAPPRCCCWLRRPTSTRWSRRSKGRTARSYATASRRRPRRRSRTRSRAVRERRRRLQADLGGAIASSRIRRARAKVERVVESGHARLEQERERRYVVALGFAIAHRSRRTAASVLAGALAFRFFLTILPLALVSVVGLGYLSSLGGSPSDAVKQFGIRGVLAST